MSPSRSVAAWMDGTDADHLFTTTLNIAELRHGIMLQQDAAAAHQLTLWLENTVRLWFDGRIVQIVENDFLRWRVLVRQAESRRKPAPAPDLLIAAVALERGMHVATRDVRPFVGTGVPVLNPFTGECFNGA